MGTKLPHHFAALAKPEGGCVDLEAFRKAAASFKPPLSHKEVDYAFCGMDENHDKQVCSFEFFGTLQIGRFFPSREHLEHLREVGALQGMPGEGGEGGLPFLAPQVEESTSTATTTTVEAPLVNLDPYKGIPAIIHGQARITVRVSGDSSGPTKTEQELIGQAFKDGLEK